MLQRGCLLLLISKCINALAASGHGAMHAVLGRCRQQSITQFDVKCMIFDTLVEPVMSYGSQVRGPDIFVLQVAPTSQVASHTRQHCAANRVHTSFVRMMDAWGGKRMH
jgi:hypothetical protein